MVCLCVCGMTGGALVSVLYDYSQHGDPAIRSLLLHILSQVIWCGIVGKIQMINIINSVGICFILISKVDGRGHMLGQ